MEWVGVRMEWVGMGGGGVESSEWSDEFAKSKYREQQR